MSSVFSSISTRTTYIRLEVFLPIEWIKWNPSKNQTSLLTHRYSTKIDASLLLDIQIRMSSSGYVNVFQWNWEWFVSRRVKLDSGFNVMAVYEVSWHGPEVIYRLTGIRKRVLWWWKRPFWFLLKLVDALSRWMFSGLYLLQGFWFVHLRLEK